MKTFDHGGHGKIGKGPDETARRGRLLHETTTREVLGAFYRVYHELGHGFLESVYERSLTIELRMRGLEVEVQVPIAVTYRGINVGTFRADLLVKRDVLIEVKAASSLVPAHVQQTLNYLSATRIEVGLLLNFGPRPTFKRLLLTNDRRPIK